MLGEPAPTSGRQDGSKRAQLLNMASDLRKHGKRPSSCGLAGRSWELSLRLQELSTTILEPPWIDVRAMS